MHIGISGSTLLKWTVWYLCLLYYFSKELFPRFFICSEVSAFQRFGQIVQFLGFLTFSLLYQDTQTFSGKEYEEIGYV